MKKLFFAVFALILVGLPLIEVSAQAELFFGQEHNYSVTFRGNGEAVVFARIAFTNFSEADLTSLKFQSDTKLNSLAAYQQILPSVCDKQQYNETTKTYDCLSYSKANYYNSGNYYGYYEYSHRADQINYKKLTATETAGEYTITLADAVRPNDQGAILLSYRSKEFAAKKIGGLFKYAFTTLAAPVQVSEVNVAIGVDSELFIKGKSAVNYQPEDVGVSAGLGETGFTNKKLDSISQNIGQGGSVRKSAKQLAEDETFMVKGAYATTKARLYAGQIIVIALAVIALTLAGIFFSRKKGDDASPTREPESTAPNAKDARVNLLNRAYIIYALIAAGLIFGLSWFIQYLTSLHWYSILPNDTEFLLVIGFILMLLLYVFFVFGIPLIIASKHGWRAFVSVFVDILIISVIFLLLLGGIMAIFK